MKYVKVANDEKDTRMELILAFYNVLENVSNPVKSKQNPHFKSKYSELLDVQNVLRQPLKEYELVVSQEWETEYLAGTATPVRTVMQTNLISKNGDYLQFSNDFPMGVATPNGQASTISYLRRYSLICIFNLTGEDDDGAAGSGLKTTSAQPQRTSPPAQRPTNQRR